MDRAANLEAELPHLRRYARSLVGDRTRADDLVQDCLERALARWGLWRRKGPLRSWLFSIMHNLYVDHLRRARNDPLTGAAPLQEMETGAGSTGAVLLRDLGHALAQLPDEQREVILLVGLQGFSYDETARITGTAKGTVMSRLSRGRERLRRLTEGEGGSGSEALRTVK